MRNTTALSATEDEVRGDWLEEADDRGGDGLHAGRDDKSGDPVEVRRVRGGGRVSISRWDEKDHEIPGD